MQVSSGNISFCKNVENKIVIKFQVRVWRLSFIVALPFSAGLLDNPELRVVLVFGYNCCKVGASNYLQRVVSTFSDMNVILAGGQVDNLASLTSDKYVSCASDSSHVCPEMSSDFSYPGF